MSKVFDSTMSTAHQWRQSWSKADLHELKASAKQYRHLIKKLDDAYQEGDAKTAKHVAKQILTSFAAKVCVAVRTSNARLVKGQWVKVPSLNDVKLFAGALDPYQPIPEPVFAREIRRPGTDLQPGSQAASAPRVILRFEWGRRALQKLDDDILSILYPASASDWAAAGKKGGREAAVKHLLVLIEAGGFDHVVTTDIKNFFGAINKSRLADLLGSALPRKAVANTILIEDGIKIVGKEKGTPAQGSSPSNLHTSSNTPKPWCKARQGIPQGSLVSNRVGYSVVLGPVLSTLPFSESIVTFGDDVVFPAKDALEGEERRKAVMSLYATSPVGSLTIGRNKVSHINDGFEFCGYWIRRLPAQWGGGWRLRPSHKAFLKWEEEAAKRYYKAGGGRTGWKAVYRYTLGAGASGPARKKGWIDSFLLWKPRLWGPERSWQNFYMQLLARLPAAPVYGPFLPLEESGFQSIGEYGASI